jgi:hypothetical protein
MRRKPRKEKDMKTRNVLLPVLGVLAAPFAIVAANAAEDYAGKVKAEIQNISGVHPGMQAGMYVCASNHLHLTGTVQNLADVALGKVKVGGKAFDLNGNLLGTATSSTKQVLLPPGGKVEFNLEFLTVTGTSIDQVKRNEVSVLEAPSLR